MKILNKLIFKELISSFFITYLVFFTITFSFDFIDKFDDILKAKLALSDTLLFFLFRCIYLHSEYSNYALLISVIIALNIMSQRNELISLFTSAISIKRILYLISIFVIFIGSINLIFISYLSPRYLFKAEQKINKNLSHIDKIDDLIFKKDFGFVFIDLVVPSENILLNTYLVDINRESKKIESIIYAKKVQKIDKDWIGDDVKKFDIDKKNVQELKSITLSEFKNLKDLSPISYKAEWLTLSDIFKVIRGGMRSGININTYIYTMTKRLFSFFSLLLLFLLSFPLGIQLGRTKKNVEVVFLSIILFTSYAICEMIIFKFSRSINLTFIFPPAILTALIIFTAYLLWKTHFFWWGGKKAPLKEKYQRQ